MLERGKELFLEEKGAISRKKEMAGIKPESEDRNNMGFGVKTGRGLCPGLATTTV